MNKKLTIIGLFIFAMLAFAMSSEATFYTYASASTFADNAENSTAEINFSVTPIINTSGSEATCDILNVTLYNDIDGSWGANGTRNNETLVLETLNNTKIGIMVGSIANNIYHYNWLIEYECGTNSSWIFDSNRTLYSQITNPTFDWMSPVNNTYYSSSSDVVYRVNMSNVLSSYNVTWFDNYNSSATTLQLGDVEQITASDTRSRYREHIYSGRINKSLIYNVSVRITYIEDEVGHADKNVDLTLYSGASNTYLKPEAYIDSPTDGSIGTTNEIDFLMRTVHDSLNVTTYYLFLNDSVGYYLNTSLDVSWTNRTQQNETESVELPNGAFSWYYIAKDNNSNYVKSSIYDFIIDNTGFIVNVPTRTSTDSCTGMNISIDTSDSTTSEINWGTTVALGNLSNSTGTNLSFTLTGLTESTRYYYNITACDTAGTCVVNGTYNTTYGWSLCSGTNYITIFNNTIRPNLTSIATGIGASYVSSISAWNRSTQSFATFTAGSTSNANHIPEIGHGIIVVMNTSRTWYDNYDKDPITLANNGAFASDFYMEMEGSGWNLMGITTGAKTTLNITTGLCLSASGSPIATCQANITWMTYYNSSNNWPFYITNRTWANDTIVKQGGVVWQYGKVNYTYARD